MTERPLSTTYRCSKAPTWASCLLLSTILLVLAGCAATSANRQWSGELARSYDADMDAVVSAAAEAVRDIGMDVEGREPDENTYVVEAFRTGNTPSGTNPVQLTGLSVYVRDLGDQGVNLQIRIPEQRTNYASRRHDSYAQKQARRILTLLDRQFSEEGAE